MRFSDTGYYIERYIKCGNCGVLVYDEGVKASDPKLEGETFCSDWCVDWRTQRVNGATTPKIKAG